MLLKFSQANHSYFTKQISNFILLHSFAFHTFLPCIATRFVLPDVSTYLKINNYSDPEQQNQTPIHLKGTPCPET